MGWVLGYLVLLKPQVQVQVFLLSWIILQDEVQVKVTRIIIRPSKSTSNLPEKQVKVQVLVKFFHA